MTKSRFQARCLMGAAMLAMSMVPAVAFSLSQTCSTTQQSFQSSSPAGTASDGSQPFSFTLPSDVTSVTIDAGGAQGGNVNTASGVGGNGAEVAGSYSVSAGATLCIVAGVRGGSGATFGGGGGGGSFVYTITSGTCASNLASVSAANLLIAAGGGGGAAGGGSFVGGNPGLATGLGSSGSPPFSFNGGNASSSGGTGGNGGSSSGGGGGGGGGLLSNGANGACGAAGPGHALINGAAGGSNSTCTGGGNGGYGGGGAGAGGGGGYNGGSGGSSVPTSSGGGGSFSAVGPSFALDGNQSGNGAVSLCYATTTHFTISAPATATANSAFSFTVTALDALNNTVTSYAGTVHFTSSDGLSVLPADSTLTNGVGTFSATLQTAGSQTITGTDSTASSITGTSNTITVSGPATHFTVTAPGSAAAGTAFNITVTALDALNNTVTSYAGTVHFTSTDGASVLPADSALTNGVGTFSATLHTAGNQTITATDSATSSITGTSNTVAVSAAAAATHFTVSAPATATANTAFNFTVTALDPFNNTVTSYTGTVHFTSGDGLSVLPIDSTLTNGVGTFSATLKTAGSQTITATDTVTTSITGTSASIVVASNNVFSGPSATGTGTITASFTGGGATCSFSAPQYVGAPPGAPPVPPTLPSGVTAFPQGMFNYSLVGCTVGSTITMTITYPSPITGAKYWKYGPEAANHTPHWYVMPAAINGNTATFSITDGGQGDDDFTANGVIGDPGGPGLGGTGIPTLSWWMLALLALGLGTTAWRADRSRRTRISS